MIELVLIAIMQDINFRHLYGSCMVIEIWYIHTLLGLRGTRLGYYTVSTQVRLQVPRFFVNWTNMTFVKLSSRAHTLCALCISTLHPWSNGIFRKLCRGVLDGMCYTFFWLMIKISGGWGSLVLRT